jgi:hypothetical protein
MNGAGFHSGPCRFKDEGQTLWQAKEVFYDR